MELQNVERKNTGTKSYIYISVQFLLQYSCQKDANHKTGNTGAMRMENMHVHSFSSPMLSFTAISGKYDESQTIELKTEKRCTVNSKETERKSSVYIHSQLPLPHFSSPQEPTQGNSGKRKKLTKNTEMVQCKPCKKRFKKKRHTHIITFISTP